MKNKFLLLSLLLCQTAPAFAMFEPQADGTLYNIRGKHGGVLIFHNAPNQQGKVEHIPYNHPYKKEDQKVYLEKTADGYLNIRSQFGSVLNFWGAPNPPARVEHIPFNHTDTREDQKVYLEQTADGFHNIRSRFGALLNFWGAPTPPGRVEHIPYNHADSREDQKVYFQLVGGSLKAEITDFQYSTPLTDLDKLAHDVSVVAWDNRNDTTAVNSHRIKISETKENSLSWSFTQGKETDFFNQLDVDVSASFFGLFGANVHNTTKWNNKTSSLTTTKTQTFDKTEIASDTTLTLLPGKKLTCLLTWSNVDMDIPFTAKVKVSGYVESIHGPNHPANGATVVKLMQQQSYPGTIDKQEDQSVLTTIKGSIHVKRALKGRLELKEEDL